jgi:hypothetical protein
LIATYLFGVIFCILLNYYFAYTVFEPECAKFSRKEKKLDIVTVTPMQWIIKTAHLQRLLQ